MHSSVKLQSPPLMYFSFARVIDLSQTGLEIVYTMSDCHLTNITLSNPLDKIPHVL